MAAVRNRYSDYEQNRVESVSLMPGFNGVTSPAFNLEQYIEGMYLIAKYASFSTAARPQPVNSPAAAITRERVFHALPGATQIPLLRAIQPELSLVDDSTLNAALTEIANQLAAEAARTLIPPGLMIPPAKPEIHQ